MEPGGALQRNPKRCQLVFGASREPGGALQRNPIGDASWWWAPVVEPGGALQRNPIGDALWLVGASRGARRRVAAESISAESY